MAECPVVKNGMTIPPYFRCPLSLELMLDPVIVASLWLQVKHMRGNPSKSGLIMG